MDALLRTNDERNALAMRDIHIFSDRSGGHCFLELKSSPFQAQIEFFFDVPSLGEFADALKALELSLIGVARLGNQYEDPFIKFEGNGRGSVTVSGRLEIPAENWQQLDFQFTTDQTALGEFIHELKEASRYAIS